MARDAYGNWISGITPAPTTPPNSLGKLRHGSGSPSSDLGNVGDGYIDTDNGDYYTKKDSGWELQSGGGGSATQVYEGLFANPNGHVTPDAPENPAIYFQSGAGLTVMWRWDTGETDWEQVLG